MIQFDSLTRKKSENCFRICCKETCRTSRRHGRRRRPAFVRPYVIRVIRNVRENNGIYSYYSQLMPIQNRPSLTRTRHHATPIPRSCWTEFTRKTLQTFHVVLHVTPNGMLYGVRMDQRSEL